MSTTTKRNLKVTHLPQVKKDAIGSFLFYASKELSDVSYMNVIFKGESFLIISKQEKSSYGIESSKKYAALKSLKAFLGHRGNKDLSDWNNSLSPQALKRSMRAVLGNSGYSSMTRMLYSFPNQDVKSLSRIRSNLGGIKNSLCEIREFWQYTAAGTKSEARKRTKLVSKTSKRIFGSVYSNMIGGVHTESGLYLKAHKEKLTKILDLNKKPMTQERHLGLELEFLLPHVNKQIVKDALLASPYKDMLTLTRDGSVTSNEKYDPAELKICAPHSKFKEAVSFVTMTLISNNCIVDKSCGLHVHLDARNDNARKMFDKLLDQQSSLFALVPKSRRNNQYCRPTTRKDYCTGPRYKSINSTAYAKFKTLEVRLHGGTLDPNKIINWTLLLTSIAYNMNDITKSRSVATMLKKLNLDANMTAFLLEREAKFSSHGSVETNEEAA